MTLPSAGHNRRLGSASQEAAKVSASWRASVHSLLDACIRINDVLEICENDDARRDRFISGLVSGGVLTEREGRLGIGSPKLSKLRTIGQHADLLRRKDIVRSLTPEYSVLYQLCVFYKKIPAKEPQRLQRFQRVISARPSELSREYLATETKRLRRQRTSRSTGQPPIRDDKIGSTLAGLIEAKQSFDLVLLTPSKKDLGLIGADYEGGTLERCLPLFNLINRARSGLLVIAPMSELPVIVTRLLPLGGFSDLSRVVLIQEPASADITDTPVVIAAQRGMQIHVPAKSTWLKDQPMEGNQTKAIKIADRLYPKLKRRLHVFAERASDGWLSLIGDHSWIELPSLR